MYRFGARSLFSLQNLSRYRVIAANYAAASGTKEHIDSLVKDKKIVVFMKGTPEAPRCGFSNAVVQVLKLHGVENYEAHDVLTDENLRQGPDILLC